MRIVVIVLVASAALALVYSHLLAQHYYILTYAGCERGSSAPLCSAWRRESLFEAVAVILLAAAAIVFVRAKKT